MNPVATALAAPGMLLLERPSPAPLRRKVLRPAEFVGRAQPLNLPALIRPVLEASKVTLSPGEWIVAAAGVISARSAEGVPHRWLHRLAQAFGVNRPVALPPECIDALPKAAWNEPALLGEWLLCARELQASAKSLSRQGRAGRQITGSVYTPAPVARMMVEEVHVGARRVVDPACGAGIFLLEAFQRAFKRRIENGATPLQAARGALSHEIAGIDIDGEALAIAEFSLRVLALRCGGLDRDVPLILKRVDALSPLPEFENQCDCIVGNPPYIEGRGLSAPVLAALRKRFHCVNSGKVNLFAVFVERSLELLRDGGVMALVLPATFQRNERYRNLREVLLQHTIESIKPLDPSAFGQRVVETVVLRVRKRPPAANSRVSLAEGKTLQSRLPVGPVLRFCDHLPRSVRRQIEVMERHGVLLGEQFEVRDGISTGFQPFPLRLLGAVVVGASHTLITPQTGIAPLGKAFVAQDGTRVPFDSSVHHRVIDGSEFHCFTPIHWAGRHIEHDKRHEHTPPHPGRSFNCQLRDAAIYDRAEKIVSRQTARGIIATVDRARFFVRNSVHVTYVKEDRPLAEQLPLSLDALCAALNSDFYSRYLLAVTGETGVVFPQVHIADLKRLPILPGLLRPEGTLAKLGRRLLDLHAGTPINAEAIAASKAEVEDILAAAFNV